MVLLKSLLTGTAAAVIVFFVMNLYAQGMAYRTRLAGDPPHGVHENIALYAPAVIVLCSLAFAAGFWWQYRRKA